jgi:hypothetical protein
MRIFPFLFASFLAVAAIAQPFPNQAPDRTWITDVRIISPEKLDHIEKGSVLIENGHIVRAPKRLYSYEIRAHTPASKLSEPLELVSGPAQMSSTERGRLFSAVCRTFLPHRRQPCICRLTS